MECIKVAEEFIRHQWQSCINLQQDVATPLQLLLSMVTVALLFPTLAVIPCYFLLLASCH
jgi:hypothetical protein